MSYTVYILKSLIRQVTYSGHTDDLSRRLYEHNAGKSIFTKRYKPWKLLYKETFNTLAEAIKRERYFKSAAGRRWIKKNIFYK